MIQPLSGNHYPEDISFTDLSATPSIDGVVMQLMRGGRPVHVGDAGGQALVDGGYGVKLSQSTFVATTADTGGRAAALTVTFNGVAEYVCPPLNIFDGTPNNRPCASP